MFSTIWPLSPITESSQSHPMAFSGIVSSLTSHGASIVMPLEYTVPARQTPLKSFILDFLTICAVSLYYVPYSTRNVVNNHKTEKQLFFRCFIIKIYSKKVCTINIGYLIYCLCLVMSNQGLSYHVVINHCHKNHKHVLRYISEQTIISWMSWNKLFLTKNIVNILLKGTIKPIS